MGSLQIKLVKRRLLWLRWVSNLIGLALYKKIALSNTDSQDTCHQRTEEGLGNSGLECKTLAPKPWDAEKRLGRFCILQSPAGTLTLDF